MDRKISSKTLGYASLICSLSFWVWLVLGMVGVMPNLGISFNYGAVLWLLLWIMAVVLAFKATARGWRCHERIKAKPLLGTNLAFFFHTNSSVSLCVLRDLCVGRFCCWF